MLTALERGKTPSEAAYCIFIPYDVCDLEQNRALKIFNIGAQPCIRNRCFQVLIYFDMATFVGNEAHRFRSEEHTSELQSLMRISYAVFCLKKKQNSQNQSTTLPYTIQTEQKLKLIKS